MDEKNNWNLKRFIHELAIPSNLMEVRRWDVMVGLEIMPINSSNILCTAFYLHFLVDNDRPPDRTPM
jgi:hypothetical protein